MPENDQRAVRSRLSLPLIERVKLEPRLDGLELVVTGGESDKDARPLYDWVLDIREQCVRKQFDFAFRQCGTHFMKDGRQYKLQATNRNLEGKNEISNCNNFRM